MRKLFRDGLALDPETTLWAVKGWQIAGVECQSAIDFGIAEDARAFGDRKIGRDNDRGALIELADQLEQQLAAGPRRMADTSSLRMTKSRRVG